MKSVVPQGQKNKKEKRDGQAASDGAQLGHLFKAGEAPRAAAQEAGPLRSAVPSWVKSTSAAAAVSATSSHRTQVPARVACTPLPVPGAHLGCREVPGKQQQAPLSFDK
ncbi:unnamed protein product [Rangifer tarandus platyrhynchus]|uniref:Uncharacterized protein n=2 Tax=Rangifer tarandus platyrhynchus TaxID=3082113 RepID=A0ABN8ZUZ7_RANTA|nr:unnamed protein product [Rangifer tarandus platyrhynchus]CAI9711757.1 unnamed protein product [Rangifer tarandus platyrhynchus]